MSILNIEGIFNVFKEWRIIINEEVFQKIKDKEMDQMIYLLDCGLKLIIATQVIIQLAQKAH